MRAMKWSVSILLALASIVLVQLPGLAAPPVIYDFEITAEESADDFIGDCGDFEIWDDAALRFRFTETYDESGDLVRLHVHGWFTDRFYNSETGASVTGTTNAYNLKVDDVRAPGALVHNGLMYHAVVPGVGLVLIDAGTWTAQLGLSDDWREAITFQSGNHENIDQDFARLCAALS